MTYKQNHTIAGARSASVVGLSTTDLLVLSGEDLSNSILYNSFYYALANDTWNILTLPNPKVPPPQAESCYAQGYSTDLLMIYGGYEGVRVPTRVLYGLNVTDHTASVLQSSPPASMPAVGMACASSPDGSYFYVFGGGASDGECSSNLFAFKYSDKSWTDFSPKNGPSLYGASMVYSTSPSDSTVQRLIIFGGSCNGSTSNETWFYSINGNNWESHNNDPRPPPRTHHAAAFDQYKNVMIVNGGRSGTGRALSDTWTFNTTTLAWKNTTLPEQPSGRWFHAHVYHEGRSIIYGGRDETSVLSDMWQFVPLVNCRGLGCNDCVTVSGCGWCKSSGVCVSGSSSGAYIAGHCDAGSFIKDIGVCVPSPWHFTVWWVIFGLVLLFTCSGVFVFIGKAVCFKDPEPAYASIQ